MIADQNQPFKVGASYTIGSHILPGEPMTHMGEALQRRVALNITTCDKIIEGVKCQQFDLGLIETPLFDEKLNYQEWMEDELVICSKMPIPPIVSQKEIQNYRLIARKEDSLTRLVISKFLAQEGLSYQSFYSISEIDNATATIQSIKWSKPNPQHPTVAIVSQLSIEDELKKGELYIARLKNTPMMRTFYLIYNPQHHQAPYFPEITKILKRCEEKILNHALLTG